MALVFKNIQGFTSTIGTSVRMLRRGWRDSERTGTRAKSVSSKSASECVWKSHPICRIVLRFVLAMMMRLSKE